MKHARLFYTFMLVTLGSLLLGGCATLQTGASEPVAVPQIIQLSQAQVSPYDIIARMRGSGTVYRLNAAQLAKLHEQGVSDQVINYMQRTYLEAVRREQRLEDWSYWTDVDGWWYGGLPYGWEEGWLP